MSSFTALMALSASKTQEQNHLVQMTIEERKRKETLQRKQQAEREAREREMEAKMRLKHFEDEKREQERRKRMEEVAKAREAALQRKKDEQRDVLLYGSKKSSSAKSLSSLNGGGGIKERRRGLLDDEDDLPSGLVLTREEIRERKQQAELRRIYNPAKKVTHSHSHKSSKRWPGGVVDIRSTQPKFDAQKPGMSVKDRIASMPNTLMKLNTVKRDTRTIDEIRMDLQKKREGKVLDGDEAKTFDDWFSTKKKTPVKKVQIQTVSVNHSGANTPTQHTVLSSSSTTTKKPNVSSSTPMKTVKPPVIKALIPKSSSQPTPVRSANSSRAGSIDKHPAPRPQSSRPLKYSAAERDRDRHGSSHSSDLGLMHSKKRPRSEGRSESPPPKKRATFAMEKEENLSKNISSAIWSMFGKKRDKYIGMDVFSDDEDMEADADDLEREEMFSSRIAKREDEEAFEEERRREEEKRRRKKGRDRQPR